MDGMVLPQIVTPGTYDLAPDVYHSDPCPVPSLSCSIAKKLLKQSPMHAHYAHPRLGAGGDFTPSAAMDDGTILHTMLLGKGGDIAAIQADDFRTKAAKEARDEARAAGKTPVLAHKLDALRANADAARRQIEAHPDARALFGPGAPEQAMIWEENGVWFRSLVDFMQSDRRKPLLDLKTTGLSAAPGEWERRLVSEYALQDAFYARGFRALTGITPPPMQFIILETDAPYGVSVMAAAPTLRAVAEAQVERAIGIWRQCMTTGEWPGYPPFIAHVEAPSWLLSQMDDEAARQEFIEAA